MAENKAYKILFITLSNIGDAILTLSVLDYLKAAFPESKITVMVAPRPSEIFLSNPMLEDVIVYDKRQGLKQNLALLKRLKKEGFDIVIDLKNTLLGSLIPAAYKAHQFWLKPKTIRHMRDIHLLKLLYPFSDLDQAQKIKRQSLPIKSNDQQYIENLLKENNIGAEDKIIVVSAGARSHIKRWPKEKFVDLINQMVEEFKAKIILIGDKDDAAINQYIARKVKFPLVDLSGKTSILQAAALLKKSGLLITNDSANLHLASYLDIPVVAIFGPTDEDKYGPWSKQSAIVKKEVFCRPCQKAQCRFKNIKCMELIKVSEVLEAIRNNLVPSSAGQKTLLWPQSQYKRILIVRTDKVGDVILSTPVIKALRDGYPFSYIAAMISPYTKAILEGNPGLDEIIIYDKKGKEKSWWGSLKFALRLKRKRFDLAVILNPSCRGNLIPFLAGIPRRVGYARKLGFLLTDKIKDDKRLGRKHEIEYNLDLVRRLGIEPQDKSTFMPISPDSEKWAAEILEKEGIGPEDKLAVLSPGASDYSKIWPPENYAALADKLAQKGYRIVLLGGPADKKISQQVASLLHVSFIDLVGNNNMSQAASLIRRCRLFISTDTGPMHIAASLGIALVALFSRNQPGLSVTRWGPSNPNSRVLHKEVGCNECLAHRCPKDFLCLKAISVDEVLAACDALLR